MNNIPKIIHQVWVGDKPAPKHWMDTWKEMHPTWGYVLWDNEMVRNYDFVNKDKILKLLGERKFHGVADIVRYEVLSDIGGVALPADSECMLPIDELISIGDYDSFACYEDETKFGDRLTPLMGATKNNELMLRLVEKMRQKETVNEPWIDSGNVFLTEVAKGYDRLMIYPSHFFMFNPMRQTSNPGDKHYCYQYSGTTYDLY